MEEQVQQPTVESTPAPAQEPAATPTPSPESAPEPRKLHDVVKAAFAKPPTDRGKHAERQPRSDTGQFAGPPKAAPPQPAPPVQRPAMPKSLRAELQALWDKGEPDLLAAIVQREADYEKGVAPLKTAKTQLEELLNEFKPYEHLMRAENATPQAAIRNYLQTAALLRQGALPQKIAALQQIAQQFGIPLEQLTQQLPTGGAPAQPAYDPQVNELRSQLQQLTAAQQEEKNARALAQIQQFAANPEHKHFDSVSERMLVLLRNPEILGSGVEVLSEQEKLKLAYDMAIQLDPAVQQKIAEERRASEEAARAAEDKRRVEQARQAAVQVTGAPAAGPAPKLNPKDLRGVVEAALQAQR